MDLPQQGPDVFLQTGYFEPRDFEYAQPLYDIAFLLQVDNLAKNLPVPEHRCFALWKAALSLDGYTTNVHRWLAQHDEGILDCKPSSRILEHLRTIASTGSLPDLQNLQSPAHQGCLRLRAIRGLGAKQLAEALGHGELTGEWLTAAQRSTGHDVEELERIWDGTAESNWEAAHVVPPLLRLLRRVDTALGNHRKWAAPDLGDGLSPVPGTVAISALITDQEFRQLCNGAALTDDPFFKSERTADRQVFLRHKLGWKVCLDFAPRRMPSGAKSLNALASQADSLAPQVDSGTRLLGDLHTHTNWSDGAASLPAMAKAAKSLGLHYLAITDHSRSSKLQDGLTPVAWLRQAVSLSLLRPGLKILHGIEADILANGSIDLPTGLLAGMDIVVGSVHTSWTPSRQSNTDRLLSAIESGLIDILGHPTSTLLGKPGVPNYYRPPVDVAWDCLFDACKKWSVALEFNCFPSRLDLMLPLLRQASEAGCWISFGSDAHARAHLEHLRIAERVLPHIRADRVLNLLHYKDLTRWLRTARKARSKASPGQRRTNQRELSLGFKRVELPPPIRVEVAHHVEVPRGARVVGLDLTASKAKATGAAMLDGMTAHTCSLNTDEDILRYVVEMHPAYVSIDSPLGLPGGGAEVNPDAGIVRVAEHDLSSVGIPAYPALIDSMKPLTLRGIKLRREIESLPNGPKVIESYPGAAQDILCIPRKQEGLDLLRAGLRELGLKGPGLNTESHDEMDAITAAIVGRFFEVGEFEPMGVPDEAQLIVPKLRPLEFARVPLICLAGFKRAGKSVVARYLALFFGFRWLKTRDLIKQLLVEDLQAPQGQQVYRKPLKIDGITDADLNEFGVIILEQYKQQPLVRKLRELVANTQCPIVVDAARDLADFETLQELHREPILWYIDAPETAIRNRLAHGRRTGNKELSVNNRIDQKMSILRSNAHACLKNDSSLEDLRWRVDDALFEAIQMGELPL